MKLEKERLLNYDKATIHVRFVQNKCDNEANDQSANVDDDESDKSFLEVKQLLNNLLLLNLKLNSKISYQKVGNKKIKKLNSDDITVVGSSTSLAPRRSTRRRKYRDVKEFTVSSSLTLLQLKVMVSRSALLNLISF